MNRNSPWIALLSDYWRMWFLGWVVLLKFVLVVVISAVGCAFPFVALALLLKMLGMLPPKGAPFPLPVRWLIGILFLGLWLPLTFYVAGSWVRWCPRVDKPYEE